ncbi:hypothetical protein DPMN_138959 [Dreissena polymorpha]|uniref:Uncharacterized protein n=1 Tax=Dreissena polymorpha TaxID=45954 RepID=A0A9D4G4T4_DREPO|nr:hypothetical protein DPMN_138959 [Dreissena polymorpha]
MRVDPCRSWDVRECPWRSGRQTRQFGEVQNCGVDPWLSGMIAPPGMLYECLMCYRRSKMGDEMTTEDKLMLMKCQLLLQKKLWLKTVS